MSVSTPRLQLDLDRRSYLLLGGALWAVFVLSAGPGLYTSTDPGSGHWSFQLFRQVCHAIPSRTFHLGEVPMAVNSRCFGVFSGFVVAWSLIPQLGRRIYRRNWVSYLFAGMVALQFADVAGNAAGVWTNTLVSRWILGSGLGATMVLMVSDLLHRSAKVRSPYPTPTDSQSNPEDPS